MERKLCQKSNDWLLVIRNGAFLMFVIPVYFSFNSQYLTFLLCVLFLFAAKG